MKVLERIMDDHVDSLFNPEMISSSQHVNKKGKPNKTALHDVVSTIKSSLEHGQQALTAFLYIKGAFTLAPCYRGIRCHHMLDKKFAKILSYLLFSWYQHRYEKFVDENSPRRSHVSTTMASCP